MNPPNYVVSQKRKNGRKKAKAHSSQSNYFPSQISNITCNTNISTARNRNTGNILTKGFTQQSLQKFSQILSKHAQPKGTNIMPSSCTSSSLSTSASASISTPFLSSSISSSNSNDLFLLSSTAFLSFEQIYEAPAALGKQLEMRWFHQTNETGPSNGNGKISKSRSGHHGIKHSMPFLRRSLSFIQMIHQSNTKKKDQDTEKRHNMLNKILGHGNDNGHGHDSTNLNHINDDILSSVFNYSVRVYNPHLAANPTTRSTRSTANQISKVGSSTTKARAKKRKLDDAHDGVIRATKRKIHEDVRKVSVFGKMFPPYRPFEKGEWVVPELMKNDFELYCERQLGKELTAKILSNKTGKNTANNRRKVMAPDESGSSQEVTDSVTGTITAVEGGNEAGVNTATKDRQERTMLRKIEESWQTMTTAEKMYWTQEAMFDKQRYLHEKRIYDNAKEGIEIDCSVIKCKVNAELRGKNNTAHGRQGFRTTGNVFYYYLYYDEHNEMGYQKEWRADLRCPFCFFNAGSDKGLLIHCRTTHGEDLDFTGGVDEHNILHVMIKSKACLHEQQQSPISNSFKKDMNDEAFTFVSTNFTNSTNKPRETIHDDFIIPFLCKPAEVTSCLDPSVRKRKIRSLEQQNGTHPEAKLQYKLLENQGPVRQYYHSRTNLPISRSEWDKDEDSDNEEDDFWIRQLGERLMNELGDVSVQEKIFMNLWNKFMKSHTVVADRSISQKCREFIVSHHNQISDINLRKHLLLHLINLWDNGILFSSSILSLMKLYDEIIATESKNKK